jgi:hypothetical protein
MADSHRPHLVFIMPTNACLGEDVVPPPPFHLGRWHKAPTGTVLVHQSRSAVTGPGGSFRLEEKQKRPAVHAERGAGPGKSRVWIRNTTHLEQMVRGGWWCGHARRSGFCPFSKFGVGGGARVLAGNLIATPPASHGSSDHHV